MDVSTFNASFTRVELFSLVAVAVVVGVVLGPGAITLEGTDSMWVEAPPRCSWRCSSSSSARSRSGRQSSSDETTVPYCRIGDRSS